MIKHYLVSHLNIKPPTACCQPPGPLYTCVIVHLSGKQFTIQNLIVFKSHIENFALRTKFSDPLCSGRHRALRHQDLKCGDHLKQDSPDMLYLCFALEKLCNIRHTIAVISISGSDEQSVLKINRFF